MRECDLGRPIHGKCKAVGGWQNMRDESGRLKCADASFRRCYGRLKNATDDNFCQLWWTCRTAPGNRETATIGRPFPWRPYNARRTPVHRMIDAASRQAPGTSCRWPPCTTPGPSMRRYTTLVTRSKHAKGRSMGHSAQRQGQPASDLACAPNSNRRPTQPCPHHRENISAG